MTAKIPEAGDTTEILLRAADLVPGEVTTERDTTAGDVRCHLRRQAWDLDPRQWRHLARGQVITMHEARPVIGTATIIEVAPPTTSEAT